MRSYLSRCTRVASVCWLALVVVTSARPAMADDLKPFTQTVPSTTIKFDMLPVKGGTVELDLPGKDGKPAKQSVAIKDFYFAKLETTWDNYSPWRVVADRPDLSKIQKGDYEALARPSPPYGVPNHGWGDENMPVLHVGYHSAKEYCKFLSTKTGRKYRLPSEAEWRYACAGGAAGGGLPKDAKELEKVAWFKDNADEQTHPCGTKAPNALGLCDMLGNVAEWCVPADGEQIAVPQGKNKKTIEPYMMGVLMGGCYLDGDNQILPDANGWTARLVYEPKWQESDTQDPKSHWWMSNLPQAGFRVVCEP